ncbi:hypothetical protein D3C81_1674810 [compost metagenome]
MRAGRQAARAQRLLLPDGRFQQAPRRLRIQVAGGHQYAGNGRRTIGMRQRPRAKRDARPQRANAQIGFGPAPYAFGIHPRRHRLGLPEQGVDGLGRVRQACAPFPQARLQYRRMAGLSAVQRGDGRIGQRIGAGGHFHHQRRGFGAETRRKRGLVNCTARQRGGQPAIMRHSGLLDRRESCMQPSYNSWPNGRVVL